MKANITLWFIVRQTDQANTKWSLPMYAPSEKELKKALRKIAPVSHFEVKPVFTFDSSTGIIKPHKEN